MTKHGVERFKRHQCNNKRGEDKDNGQKEVKEEAIAKSSSEQSGLSLNSIKVQSIQLDKDLKRYWSVIQRESEALL